MFFNPFSTYVGILWWSILGWGWRVIPRFTIWCCAFGCGHTWKWLRWWWSLSMWWFVQRARLVGASCMAILIAGPVIFLRLSICVKVVFYSLISNSHFTGRIIRHLHEITLCGCGG